MGREQLQMEQAALREPSSQVVENQGIRIFPVQGFNARKFSGNSLPKGEGRGEGKTGDRVPNPVGSTGNALVEFGVGTASSLAKVLII